MKTQPHSLCRFGIARRDVTPPVGIYHRMWGAAKHDRSEGVHRALTATALVFQPDTDSDNCQIILALDHCLLYQPEIQQLIKQICDNSKCSPDQLIITFSHTHAAGLMDPRRFDMAGGDLIEPYLQQLYQISSEVIAEAQKKTQPAIIRYATGRCALAANRDFWDEENKIFVCGYNPNAPADDIVMVAQVDGTSGESLATIVNYACHPTTLAWDNRLISPDFVGAMRETVERSSAAGGLASSPCVFFQGASGDLGPRQGFVGDPEVADRNGRQLAYAVLSGLESLLPPLHKLEYVGPVVSGATIGEWRAGEFADAELQSKKNWRCKRWTVPLSYRPELLTADQAQQQLANWTREEQLARDAGDDKKAADARAMAERMRRQLSRLADLPEGDTFPFPVVMWQMGDAVWLAVEGEPYSLLQTSLRQRFPETPIFVVELSGGSRVSYLPSEKTYGTGVYQETIAILQKGSLEQLVDAIRCELAVWLDPAS